MDQPHRRGEDRHAAVVAPHPERGVPQLNEPGYREQLRRRTPSAKESHQQRSGHRPRAHRCGRHQNPVSDVDDEPGST